MMFSYIGFRNALGMLVGTGLALAAISILLIFVLKSLRYGLLTLIPNVAPAAMAFGIWDLRTGRSGWVFPLSAP